MPRAQPAPLSDAERLVLAIHDWQAAKVAAEEARRTESECRTALVAALKAMGVEGFSL